MRRFFYAALGAVALLAACSVAPKDAPQGAYEATVTFAAALKAANAYAAMPRCSAVQKDPCSRQEIVVQMAAAAHKADEAVKGAQVVAKDTATTDANRQKAVAAANDAVAALNRIIPSAESH
jgi:hypothetical protein